MFPILIVAVLANQSITNPVAADLSSIGLQQSPVVPAAAARATDILRHLDLGSFPNSTGPRRKPALHTPVDYGLTHFQSFGDGWAQASEPDDGWHMSAFLLEGASKSVTICFVDAGGKGATYRATEVLHVQLGTGDQLSATQIADRPGCRNDPPFKAG